MSRRQFPKGADEAQRCEALMLDSYLRPTNDRCGNFASMKIGRRRLCGKHAGAVALQQLLDRGEARQLPYIHPQRREPRLVGRDEIRR